MTDIILALATWRVSHLLVSEDAPYSLAARFRNAIGIKFNEFSHPVATNELAKLFSCVYCLSVWVGGLIALIHHRDWRFIPYGLAYSAVSIIIEVYVNRMSRR